MKSMRVGLFTDALGDRSLATALAWLAREVPEVRDVEIATGGYSSAPHCDLAALAASGEERRRWLATIENAGFRLAALNVSGNPLREAVHDRALRDTVRLAGALGVDRVVCMSGGSPELAGGGWMPGLEEALEREWEGRVLPYWDDVSALARSEHDALSLCLELEPGAAVFNVATFERVAAAGPNVAVNLDPSHLFWQAIDPLAAIERLGARIRFAHGKDTVIDDARVAVDGLVDRRTWRYATMGRGHDVAWWAAFADALAAAGYDGVISIEHEDAEIDAEAAIGEGARVLAAATAGVAA
jgi:sugar phosphate isomerase/epimerase